MKKFFKYWSPTLAWMGFIFPLVNPSLGSPKIWRVYYTTMIKLFPQATYRELSVAYVAFRKTWHFIEYAVLFALIYRALRAGRGQRWQKSRALVAGLAAFGFGFLDEFLQSFVPGRSGSPFDWAVDTAGLLTGLALVYFWARRKGPAGPRTGEVVSGSPGGRPGS